MKVCSKCGRTSDMDAAVCPGCKGALITALEGATDGPLALAIEAHEEAPPDIPDYRIEKMIGVGGMGIVYGAVHRTIGKRAAIKVLNARFGADQEAVRRLMREAKAVNQIGHANIVDIFAIGQLDDGRPYLVMEWLQGETLMKRLEREPLTLTQTIAILLALTRALEAAHSAGVIHRDLKPENVVLVPDDETFRIKLLDFGIAKLETRRAPTSVTASGVTVGTPLYMSPEQAKGVANDGLTDVYSLGVLAYAMVTGKTPFEDEDSAVEILHAHISKPPRSPREIVGDLPVVLDTLILQMLAKAPADRPPLKEIRTRLKNVSVDNGGFETFTSETPLPNRVGAPPQPHLRTLLIPKPRSRVPLYVGICALLLGVGVFVVARQTSNPDDAVALPSSITPATTPARVEAPPTLEPPAPTGTVELAIQPTRATATIDGKTIRLDAGHARVELPPGTHVVTTLASGYQSDEHTFEVTASAITPVKITMAKLQRRKPPPTAKIKRKPRPKDVDAVVDPFKRKAPR